MKLSDQRAVGASYAKTHFAELLQRVAAGEVITITRHGSAVARLVPVRATSSAESRQEAIHSMRRLAGRNRLCGLQVKDLIAEGRK